MLRIPHSTEKWCMSTTTINKETMKTRPNRLNVLYQKIQRLKLNDICVCVYIQVWMPLKYLYLHVSAWRYRTCVPLEARAPLGAAYNFVGMRVAGFEERVRARLVPVQVEALDLRLVQLEVKVCVQPGEHPAQRVLTNRWRPDLKLWGRSGLQMREGRCSQVSQCNNANVNDNNVNVTHCSSLASGSGLSCGCHSHAALWTSLSDDSPPPSGPTHCTLRHKG